MSRSDEQTIDFTGEDDSCRRDKPKDRRQNRVRAMGYTLVKKRRKHVRREHDGSHDRYVDFHEPALFFLTIAILLLCVADAFFTLTILHLGGEEINPFMKVLLERNVLLFFAVKFILTSIFLIFTVIHKHFRLFNRITGYQILYTVFFMYMTLVVYEIYILFLQR